MRRMGTEVWGPPNYESERGHTIKDAVLASECEVGLDPIASERPLHHDSGG